MRSRSWSPRPRRSTVEGIEVAFPDFMKEIVAEITHQARR